MNEATEQPVDDTTLSGQERDSTVTLRRSGLDADRRIGAYKLIRELGRGGMGTVWLAARADDQFEKRVALKVVRGSDSDEVLRFFRRERQILAGLEHPNIARLLDGGTTEDGLPYFVMEHVEGVPIDRYCDEHKLSVPERLRLFEGVCSAVQHAHGSLVVHRDLKPRNILVTERRSAQAPRLRHREAAQPRGGRRQLAGDGAGDDAGLRQSGAGARPGDHHRRPTCTRWGSSSTSCSPDIAPTG